MPEIADLISPLRLAEHASGGQYRWAPHLQMIEQEVMQTLLGDWDVCVVQAPPRHGKSEYISRWLPAWHHSVYPHLPSILTSYSIELARNHSRWVRDTVHRVAPWFGHEGVKLTAAAASDWQMAGQDFGMKAAGVGGGITGRGAHVFVIDDALKNAEQAISARVRESQWEWFQTTAFTRIEPGGKLLVLGCLVGDTRVGVPGGSVPIRDIRAGDVVETFRAGKLSKSKVLNHANVGHDKVFRIILRSGRTVTGNERHPFLVSINGVLKWLRLKNLRTGDRLISSVASQGVEINPTPEAFAADTTRNFSSEFPEKSGHMETVNITDHASGINVTSPQYARDIAAAITQNVGCSTAIGHHQPTRDHIVSRTSNIATASLLNSSMRYSLLKAGFAPSVGNHLTSGIPGSTKEGSFASTIATEPDGFAGFSATPAIWRPDTLKHPNVPSHSLDTSSFTSDEVIAVRPAGIEPVFDIEVEETGNFIANGLVTHNTRWHEEDLIGMILKAASTDLGMRVRELRLPALAEPSEFGADPLGRATDEPLWPDRWTYDALSRIRDTLEPYWWDALYQQRLGAYGKNEWPPQYFYGIMAQDDEWPDRMALSATALDPSKGKNAKKGDYSAIVNVGFKNGYLWVECDMERRPVPQMVEDLVEFNIHRRPTVTGIESVAFQELVADSYAQACSERGHYDEPVLIDQKVRKELRIARLGFWLRLHRIKIRNTPGGQMLLKQLKEFPNAEHDDGPDALEMALRLMLQISDDLQEIDQQRQAASVLQA